jgi:hypothetical protein
MAANDFALIVGVRDYPDFSSLGGPVEDAIRLETWIRDKNGGNIPKSNVFPIHSKPKPPTPLQQVIDDAIDLIQQAIVANHNSRARRLYFYFSGHGFAMKNDENSLCMANWSHRMRNSALSSREYLNHFVETGFFEEIIFVLDCCRSRLVGHKSHHPNVGLPIPGPLAGATKSMVIYAAEFQNAAYEVQYQNGDDEMPVVHGHLTEALIRALNGEAVDSNGNITGDAVAQFVEVEVPRLADNHNQSQKAVVQTMGFNLKALVFGALRNNSNPNCTINFVGRNGMIRLEDGDYNLIREGDASTGPWSLQLGASRHTIIELATGEEETLRVLPNVDNQTFQF